jgi:hypothetical protein
MSRAMNWSLATHDGALALAARTHGFSVVGIPR